jgi:hypothetical protein
MSASKTLGKHVRAPRMAAAPAGRNVHPLRPASHATLASGCSSWTGYLIWGTETLTGDAQLVCGWRPCTAVLSLVGVQEKHGRHATHLLLGTLCRLDRKPRGVTSPA